MAKAFTNWEDRIGRHFTLWDLNVLHKCISVGSISKAADELRISKPAISKTITSLERELGTELVTRSWRGLEPTAAGRALMSRGSAALSELQIAVESIRDLSESKSGELRIAANEVAMSGLIGTVINRLHAEHPGIIFEVVSAYTRADQIHELERGNVELIVGQVAESDHQLEMIELFQDRLVVAAGSSSRWLEREALTLSELIDEPWAFSPPNSVSGRTMEQAFRLNGLDLPRIAIVSSSMQLLRRLVTGGEFLALLPRSVARASPGIAILPVAVNAYWQPIGVLTVKHRTLSPLAHLFIDYAHNVVRGMAAV